MVGHPEVIESNFCLGSCQIAEAVIKLDRSSKVDLWKVGGKFAGFARGLRRGFELSNFLG
jgi:hypothetical protein